MEFTAKQIIESLPNRFRPEKARDYKVVIQIKITGAEHLNYTIEIGQGACILKEGLTQKFDSSASSFCIGLYWSRKW